MLLWGTVYTMDNPELTPQKEANKSPESIVREIVRKSVQDKEASYKKKESEKDYSNRVKKHDIGVVAVPSVLVDAEINAGPLSIKGDRGIMCTDNKIFIVDHKKEKLIRHFNFAATSAITALASCNINKGSDKILIGEEQGQILVADSKGYNVIPFGNVKGKVLAIFTNAKGTKIAVKFLNKDKDNLEVPCFALSASFKHLKQNQSPRNITRMGGLFWSEFVAKQCNQEVKDISFDKHYCVTLWASGALEKWKVKNREKNARLKKIID